MENPPAATHGTRELGALAQAIDATGADLYREVAAAGANTVFSPGSIAVALRMALQGARGETAAELARFLHVSDAAAAGDALPVLSADLAAAARAADFTFRMPNAMWVQSGLPLEPAFTGWIRRIAEADVRDADFLHEAEKARLEINQVIAAQTAGKITDLLTPGVLGPATRLVLTNAVYLKAQWAHPFSAAATDDAPFHLERGGTVTARMMHVTTNLGYLRAAGHQAVTLPYKGGRLAMTVVLPDGPLAPLEASLARDGLRSLAAGARVTDVALVLPRFRMTADFTLSTVLQRLGVKQAFRDDADFSGITSAERLKIDEVVHKAYVDVDEKGTEAAAATAVIMRVAARIAPARPPVSVRVDRPFLFAISDTVTGAPLFLGRVANPAAR
jgi:serine protease inhibitor